MLYKFITFATLFISTSSSAALISYTNQADYLPSLSSTTSMLYFDSLSACSIITNDDTPSCINIEKNNVLSILPRAPSYSDAT